MSEPGDEDDRARIEAVIDRAATGLRAAGDDRAAIIRVFESFLDEGMAVVYSPSAMWDYLGTVLRRAGLDAAQQDRRYRIFSTVTNRRFRGGKPYPPDWPWHETPDAEPGDAPGPAA
jgi:hypothetical protein